MSNIISRPDHAFFQFDVNGTITLGDKTKNMNTIVSEVAGVILGKWDEDHPAMIYKEYVQKILFPGNKYDKEIKKAQEEKIGRFIDDLKKANHPLHDKAFALYEALAKDYLDPETNQVKFTVFPSIIKLIKKVEQICSYSITLRTFGNDGLVVAEEFSRHGIPFSRCATMIRGGMQLEGEAVIKTGPELLKTLQQAHTVGQDQVDVWFKGNRTAATGKVIPCVEDGNFEGKTVVTLFMDDNLTKRPKSTDGKASWADPDEHNIAFPQDIYGRQTSWKASRGFIGVRIDPVKAALDEDYVIKKVNKKLVKRGFSPLEG